MINNPNAQTAIDDCNAELSRITGIINGVGSTSPLSGYLTKYSLIRICGTLEVCYKTIIADYYENLAPQLGRYIGYHLRDASMNPTYDNICHAIKRFDDVRQQNFKSAVDALPEEEPLFRRENGRYRVCGLYFTWLCSIGEPDVPVLQSRDIHVRGAAACDFRHSGTFLLRHPYGLLLFARQILPQSVRKEQIAHHIGPDHRTRSI